MTFLDGDYSKNNRASALYYYTEEAGAQIIRSYSCSLENALRDCFLQRFTSIINGAQANMKTSLCALYSRGWSNKGEARRNGVEEMGLRQDKEQHGAE